MLVNIANHEFPYLWDNVYYFTLSNYPIISDWELKKLIMFNDYERAHGRETQFVCENESIMDAVNRALAQPAPFLSARKPVKITECTACKQGGCLTEFLCHTAGIESAKAIFRCGKLLSAVKASNKSGPELAKEPRNVVSDPPDYFEYIMFSWGNCQAGDRLVMERLLNRFPDETDVSVGFKPGVRFYFRYDALAAHEGFTNDGNHPAKIKNELALSDCLLLCIIPQPHKKDFEDVIPPLLKHRVFYMENDCKDIWDWSEKVYNFVCEQARVL